MAPVIGLYVNQSFVPMAETYFIRNGSAVTIGGEDVGNCDAASYVYVPSNYTDPRALYPNFRAVSINSTDPDGNAVTLCEFVISGVGLISA